MNKTNYRYKRVWWPFATVRIICVLPQ